jgi:hypothetical protein
MVMAFIGNSATVFHHWYRYASTVFYLYYRTINVKGGYKRPNTNKYSDRDRYNISIPVCCKNIPNAENQKKSQ